VWGCLARVKILENKRKKIGLKTADEIFIRYASDNNANRFLIINSEISDISKNTIVEARDAHYFENIFHIKPDLIQVSLKTIMSGQKNALVGIRFL